MCHIVYEKVLPTKAENRRMNEIFNVVNCSDSCLERISYNSINPNFVEEYVQMLK